MKYDKSLFASTADYYVKYRPKYSQEIFDKIIEIFKPIENDILLDLGCGTGELALPLSKTFGKVIAWDPDADMLRLAKQKADEQDVKNVVFEQKSSDDLSGLTEKIKLCTMGQSFHWMDGTDTLIEIKKHLVDNGGVAIIGLKHGLHIYSPTFDEPNEITAERNRIVSEVGVKYLGAERKAGHSVFTRGKKSFEDMLNEAGFADIEETVLDVMVRRTTDDVIGWLFSSSWGNSDQLGDKAEAFEQELRERLKELKPDGVFDERISFWLLTAKSLSNKEQE
ncbi:class I SAM-dependent methyltransferase [Candidatus Saccharibacteria bacterium]|nr:class I SAM-dependent methyltransferase [Candidatus Saccharibacteria bacterium]